MSSALFPLETLVQCRKPVRPSPVRMVSLVWKWCWNNLHVACKPKIAGAAAALFAFQLQQPPQVRLDDKFSRWRIFLLDTTCLIFPAEWMVVAAAPFCRKIMVCVVTSSCCKSQHATAYVLNEKPWCDINGCKFEQVCDFLQLINAKCCRLSHLCYSPHIT